MTIMAPLVDNKNSAGGINPARAFLTSNKPRSVKIVFLKESPFFAVFTYADL
jgi:hypothetical protein